MCAQRARIVGVEFAAGQAPKACDAATEFTCHGLAIARYPAIGIADPAAVERAAAGA